MSNNHNLLKNEKNGNFDFNEYINLKVPVVDVEKEINTIKLIFDEVMNHKATHFRSADLEKFKDDRLTLI